VMGQVEHFSSESPQSEEGGRAQPQKAPAYRGGRSHAKSAPGPEEGTPGPAGWRSTSPPGSISRLGSMWSEDRQSLGPSAVGEGGGLECRSGARQTATV
jgi:hypothetical protein